jgi:hypothetical protein
MSFQDKTRQNIKMLPSQTVTEGGRLYFRLPATGLLSKLFLFFDGVVTVTEGSNGTNALSDRGIYNLIKRVKLVANGATSIIDVSGYGLSTINNLIRYGHRKNNSLVTDATMLAQVYAAPLAAGDNAWKFGLEVPIAINDRDPVGLILLQNSATEVVLEIEFNNVDGANNLVAPVVVTGDDTAVLKSGSLSVAMEYFTVPRNKEDYPALNVVHQWVEIQKAITSVGANVVDLQRGDTYMRLVHNLTIQNALSTATVDKLRILYNSSEEPYTIDKNIQLMLQMSRYGMCLPIGTFVHDWNYAGGLVGLSPSRDFINSANVTEFQSVLEIASGTTMTAGQCFINTLSEKLIRIA